jgi:hypothetical protein
VRVASDPETTKQLPEVRILSGETTQFDLVLGRGTDTLAVEGLILDERGQPLPERCLFVQVADHPMANITSDSLGAFREWSGMGERVTVEPRLEHPSERFDPPFWEGPRGTRGVLIQLTTAGEWADVTVRVIDRSTRTLIDEAALEYNIRLRSGTYGVSSRFDGELRARLPVAEGLSMTVSALDFNVVTFPSTALRERAAAGGVLEIELERRAVPKPDRFRGDVEGGGSIESAIDRSRAGGH